MPEIREEIQQAESGDPCRGAGLGMTRAKAFLLAYLAMLLVPIPVHGLFAVLGWM